MKRVERIMKVVLAVLTLATFYAEIFARTMRIQSGPVRNLPTVDPGVFVITDVMTCGGGKGYCILGSTCSVDSDFTSDDNAGHCGFLAQAFSPKARFVCCQQSKKPLPTVEEQVPEAGELQERIEQLSKRNSTQNFTFTELELCCDDDTEAPLIPSKAVT